MKEESWIEKYWRPSLAYAYIVMLLFDFVIAPVLWSLFQYFALGSVVLAWSPLTLQSGGLIHATIGGVLGISAYSRGQEKIETIKNSSA